MNQQQSTLLQGNKRAILYARVSTDEQAATGTSLSSQKSNGYAYAKKNDLEIVSIFSDDFTGSSLNRPGLTKAREWLATGKADALIVYDSDRLSREPLHYMILRDEFNELGIELHYSQRGRIDLKDDGQMIIEDIQGRFAYKWKKKIVELTTNGRREKSKKGNIMLVRAPYGYTIHKDIDTLSNGKIIVTNRALVIEPTEAEVIKLIYQLYVVDGYSIRGIAQHLTKAGYKTRGDKIATYHKKRRPGQWGQTTVAKILSNSAYRGLITYAGIEVNVPSIVDVQLWNNAQRRREDNRKRKRRQAKHNYLLTGRVICHHCNTRMAGTTTISGNHQYYRCQASIKGLRVVYCKDNVLFRSSEVDTKVLDEIEAILMDEKRLVHGLKAHQREQAEKHKPLMDELTRVERLLSDRRKKQKRLLDLYLDAGIDKGLFKTRQTEIETDITETEHRKAELEKALEIVNLTPDRIKNVTDFAKKVREGLTNFRKNTDIQRKIINLLDVTVNLENRDDGTKAVHFKCCIDLKESVGTLSTSSE